ncbi:MAG: hypothetical protein ABIH00_01160 [Armatimonadota bacterium]
MGINGPSINKISTPFNYISKENSIAFNNDSPGKTAEKLKELSSSLVSDALSDDPVINEALKFTRSKWVEKCRDMETGDLVRHSEKFLKRIKSGEINPEELENCTIKLNIVLIEFEKRARENPEKFYDDLKTYYKEGDTRIVLRKAYDLFLRLASVSDKDPFIINICRKILWSIAQPDTEVKLEEEKVRLKDIKGDNFDEWTKNVRELGAGNLLNCAENYLLQIQFKPEKMTPKQEHEYIKRIAVLRSKVKIIFAELAKRAENNMPALRKELSVKTAEKSNLSRMFELALKTYETAGDIYPDVAAECAGFTEKFCGVDKWNYAAAEDMVDNIGAAFNAVKLFCGKERELTRSLKYSRSELENFKKSNKYINNYISGIFKELTNRAQTEPLRLYKDLNDKNSFNKLFEAILASYDYNSRYSPEAVKNRGEFVEKFSYNIGCCESGLKDLSAKDLYAHAISAIEIAKIADPYTSTPSADRNKLGKDIQKTACKSVEFVFRELTKRCAEDPFKICGELDSEDIGLETFTRLIANMPDFKGISDEAVKASRQFPGENTVSARTIINNEFTEKDKEVKKTEDKRENYARDRLKAEEEGKTKDADSLKRKLDAATDYVNIMKQRSKENAEKYGRIYGEFIGALFGALISKYSPGKAAKILYEVVSAEGAFTARKGNMYDPASVSGTLKIDLMKLLERVIQEANNDKINKFLEENKLLYPLGKVDLPPYSEDEFCVGFYRGFKNYSEILIKGMQK